MLPEYAEDIPIMNNATTLAEPYGLDLSIYDHGKWDPTSLEGIVVAENMGPNASSRDRYIPYYLHEVALFCFFLRKLVSVKVVGINVRRIL
jgi:hypothetical protein